MLLKLCLDVKVAFLDLVGLSSLLACLCEAGQNVLLIPEDFASPHAKSSSLSGQCRDLLIFLLWLWLMSKSFSQIGHNLKIVSRLMESYFN